MASTDFTKQDFINFFQTLSSDEKVTLTKELGYQKIPEKKTKKNKKHTENLSFQPTKCSARILVPETDENGDPIIHSTDKNIHFQFISVQCCAPIHENGLCKTCLKPQNRFKSCVEKGTAPFGRFNDGQDPDFYTRISPHSKDKHTYYIKGKSIPEDVKHLQSDTPIKIKKNKTPKNNDTNNDSHKDVDWKQTFIDDEVSKKKVPQLKSFVNHNSITIDSQKSNKSELVKAVQVFLQNKYGTTQQDEPPQDEPPHDEPQQDDTPIVEPQQDEPQQDEPLQDDSTQDINESTALDATVTDAELFREQEARLQNQVNLARSELEALQQDNDDDDDDDLFAENEDDDDDTIPTIEIERVIYHIMDGFAIDITTGDKVGPIDENPIDWKSAGRNIHAKNIESLQKNI